MDNSTENLSRARKVSTFLVRLFGLFFLIATIATVISLLQVNDLLANSTSVDGQVVNISYGSKGTRAPVVRFTTSNGETLELKSQFYTSPGPNVGDTVKVLYRTANPQDWQINDWFHLYFPTLFGGVFMFAWGVAAVTTKLVTDHQIRKRERAQAP